MKQFLLPLLFFCIGLVASAQSAQEYFDKAKSYYDNQNYTEAVKWWRKAAQMGHARAQNGLGVCYYNGYGVTKDETEAAKWYLKAAEQGYAQAQYNLGLCYFYALGVRGDNTEATKWYRKAAEQGHANAQFDLGVCYQLGTGVTQNDSEALKWYRRAAEQGHVDAQYSVGTYYDKGADGYEEAAKWYKMAADQGLPEAKDKYNQVIKKIQNPANAAVEELFKQGIHFAFDRDDYKEAVKYFRKAADQGHTWAQYMLGSCYEDGDGVIQDYIEAAKWYKKAADQGLAEAKTRYELVLAKIPSKENTATAIPEKSINRSKVINVNGASFNMILVESGSFIMGSNNRNDNEKPAHSVTISNNYYIGETEVTQALWKAVMGQTPTQSGDQWDEDHGLGSDFPAYYVNWNDVQSFINKLNSLTGKRFRLPTEAEWEYAAKGGKNSRNYTYSGSNDLDEVAEYDDRSDFELEMNFVFEFTTGFKSTQKVKSKKPNELGIYDMTGNVEEWCSDRWSNNYYSNSPSLNPIGPSTGNSRVVRGGGISTRKPSECVISYRDCYTPDTRYNCTGFRLVLGN